MEVSFRAELDDRGVDALADTLWEMGYDDLCFRPLPMTSAEYNASLPRDVTGFVCKDCGRSYLSWGHHAERCTGVRA